MIGGTDIVLRGPGAADECAFIVTWLRQAWRDLVVQEATADDAVGPEDETIASMRELFVYRTRVDFEAWMNDGATEENADTMIHVILGKASTTLVTASVESRAETGALGFALRDAALAHRVVAELRGRHLEHTPQRGSARRFRELLNDLILELPDANQRMEAIAACWAAMADDERTEAERSLMHEAPTRSAGLAPLVDVKVARGQRIPPTRRAA